MALPGEVPTPGATPPPGPRLPGSIAGGPSGPGAPLPTTAGIGAGNEAAADGLVASVLGTLHKALSSYSPGSKKYMGVLNAIRSLSPSFAKQAQQSLVPAAIQQQAMMAKQGGPMATAPPPPLAPVAPKGMPSPITPPGGNPMGAAA